MKRFGLRFLSACFAVSLAVPAFAAGEVKMSSTIGPVDAGIVPLLAQTYEKKTGTKVTFEGAGTGETLEKAKTGKFDLVMVHARKLEDQFVKDGYGVDRRDVMFNDFVILGPQSDPAGIRGMKDAVEAFRKIAAAKVPFMTRGDTSGTCIKEMEVWEKAGIRPDPEGDWYQVYSLGRLGNKATTAFADKRNCYLLMDRATYLTMKKEIKLVPLVEKDPILLNFIAVIAVNPKKFPAVNAAGAKAFMDWLVTDEAQQIVKDFKVKQYGEPLFFPNSDQWKKNHPNG
jgi:tungstate transport system substrate-binding protein